MTIEKIRKRKEEILRLAELHGVKSVKIFGSVAKGLSTKGSDVDFLVEMNTEQTLLDRIAFKQDLEILLKSEIYVISHTAVKQRMKSKIEKEAVLL